MTTYEKVHKAYTEALKNNFFDAWGIVASAKTIYELLTETSEVLMLNPATAPGQYKIFGLVVIRDDLVDDDKVYIVDEQLGRTILGGHIR